VQTRWGDRVTSKGLPAAVVVLLLASPAAGGLFQDLYRGLHLAATPSGSPVFTNGIGFRVNGQRSGRLRIVPNRAGRGWRLEFDRSFGLDGAGRPEVLDLGNAELELSGSMNSTVDFTRRGIPTGNTVFNINNLNYSIRGKSGAQDIELRGTLNVNQSLEINPLGFYSVLIDISNANSELRLDGVAVEGDQDTDFDIGPITARGNIFFDAVIAMLAGLGVDTESLEGVFPRSPIDRIADEIRQSLADQTKALGSRILTDPNAFTDPALAAEAAALTRELLSAAQDAGPLPGRTAVPEAPSLVLLGLGALAMLRRRR